MTNDENVLMNSALFMILQLLCKLIIILQLYVLFLYTLY